MALQTKPETKAYVPNTTKVVEEPPKLVKQFELSDQDAEYLGAAQYSDSAWEAVGRKHGIDPATREVVEGTNHRAFTAEVKRYTKPVVVQDKNPIIGIRTINSDPIPASDIGSIRTELRGRNLTKPVNDTMTKEEI